MQSLSLNKIYSFTSNKRMQFLMVLLSLTKVGIVYKITRNPRLCFKKGVLSFYFVYVQKKKNTAVV